jgi:hypothetical protein
MWLLNHHVDFTVPAASTIGDILKREGLVPDKKRKRRTPGNRQPLTIISENNQVWSADFKGKFRLLSRVLPSLHPDRQSQPVSAELPGNGP